MPLNTENLYKIQKKDIAKAGAVLANAFQNDPFWKEVLAEADLHQKQYFFESPIKYCLTYGKIYATSEKLEGIAGWVLSDFADMTFWRSIRCGSFFSSLKMGFKMAMNFIKMKDIFEPLEINRQINMQGRKYIYFMIIGVVNELQGKGYGKKLLEALIEDSEDSGLPIYTETTTDRNVKMYEKLGFSAFEKVICPVVELPQWGMIREVKNGNAELK